MQTATIARWLLAIVTLCLVLSSQNAVAGPFGIPPMPEDPLLSKIAPEECLWYASWAGSATPRADSPNHFEALIAEEEIQRLIELIEKMFAEGIAKSSRDNPEAAASMHESMKLLKSFVHRPHT